MTVAKANSTDIAIITLIVLIVLITFCFVYTLLVIYCVKNKTIKRANIENDRKKAMEIHMMQVNQQGEIMEGIPEEFRWRMN